MREVWPDPGRAERYGGLTGTGFLSGTGFEPRPEHLTGPAGDPGRVFALRGAG